MELGDFFGGVLDLGSSYIASKFAPTPSYPIQTQAFLPTQSTLAAGFVAPPGVVGGGGGGVMVPPGNGGGGGSCGGASPVWKKVCGVYKWVTPKRRRRKQLLTQSDAAGLAKLKGIVGQGKVMEVWIATHSK